MALAERSLADRAARAPLLLRMGLVAVAVVLLFSVLTAWVLETAFRDNAADAAETRLEAQVLLLMGMVEVLAEDDVRVPQMLPESRLQLPGGGLYARILGPTGDTVWRSPSAVATELNDWTRDEYFAYSMTVRWQLDGESVPLVFQMLEDRSAFDEQVESYRYSLWQGLLTMTLSLIVALILALWFWGLRPLRRVRAELDALRHGDRVHLEGPYPREIGALTGSINDLIDFERERLVRQQNALADLAHSLKTPIASLRLNLEGHAPDHEDLRRQVDRLQAMVQHQLNQAQRVGPVPFQTPEPLAPVIERTCRALRRLAEHQGVSLETDLAEGCALRMDSGAMLELLGNLLDNAVRHARSRVRITTHCDGRETVLTVDDDGPGIEPADRERVLERGQRADTREDVHGQAAGQGLGLSIIHTLVSDHGGQLEIERAPELGGARLRLVFAPVGD
ncbi:ATP-binding protein [Thioalkalivibrio sp. AKL17]|uniref:ATP-binding protein n=1 Tax=Thioalkalivibrio sp. AKL17 TaxID=1158160 RepID=UPI00036123A1|nr:ATP-binding protein [Thioalkalivibrio sp. AKL17]